MGVSGIAFDASYKALGGDGSEYVGNIRRRKRIELAGCLVDRVSKTEQPNWAVLP